MIQAPHLLSLPGIRHGFLTRRGGVSPSGAFDSLNCGFSGGDDPDHVVTNRAIAMARIGVRPEGLATARQVHGTAVVVAREPSPGPSSLEADALVTDRRGITVGVLSADCAPILLADADAGVVGAVHAGWRGALAGVVEATVEAMLALGAARSRLRAAVGPCIAQASYEVGPELRQSFVDEDPASDRWFRPVEGSDRLLLDLEAYVQGRLARAGVRHVDGVGADTCADEPRFFSARRTRKAGGERFGLLLSAIGVVDRG
jgi:YfiH family protein